MGQFDGAAAAALEDELRAVFASGKTKTAEWRIEQLNGIARFAQEHEQDIVDALYADLKKPAAEALLGEAKNSANHATSAAGKVKTWMAEEKFTSEVPFLSNASLIPEPLGLVLVIAPWNFPIALSLNPLCGAVAAGNCVVIKPSEVAPASSALLAKYLPQYVDSSAIRVIEGAVPETSALLDQRWDKIFYTGSTRVGKIVMAAAAKNLTPVTLELGGKSPTIVDSGADLEMVAKKITLGKWGMNLGQVCVAPDYLLVKESILPELVEKIKTTIKQFYGEDPSSSPDLGRIVNGNHFDRLMGMLSDKDLHSKTVHGGHGKKEKLYIEPTVILDPPMDAQIMQEEIFGPLLVVIPVKDIDQAIKFVNMRPKPLALYVFTSDKGVVDRVLHETSAGGVTVNDTFTHLIHPGLPFGGVGDSGMGNYHGKYSFDAFTHMKPVVFQDIAQSRVPAYPPYSLTKLAS